VKNAVTKSSVSFDSLPEDSYADNVGGLRLQENSLSGVSEVNVLRNTLKNNGQLSSKSASRNAFTASTTFR
jgi:hypothetical protein